MVYLSPRVWGTVTRKGEKRMKQSMVLAAVLTAVCAVEAKVELGVPFTDGVVLQRDRAVPVWGTADAGEKVTVAFAGQSVSTAAAADGRWCAQLAPMKASCESRTLTVRGSKRADASWRNGWGLFAGEKDVTTIEVKDVLVGEVWFCAGQSNTEQPLCGGNPHFRDAKGSMRARMTNKPLIRFCHQSNYRTSVEPKTVAAKKVEWKTFTPANLMGGRSFSAMGVYFALEIHNAIGIPVGIVGTYWGGTRAEPWTPKSGLASVPSCKALAEQTLLDGAAFDAAKKAKKAPYGRIQDQPRVLWNEMVAPWTPFAIRGFIWYQGCSNAGEGHKYADKMHALYNGWATEFQNPDLKLYFVQLAPWGYDRIAAIQEGQAIFAAAERNAGMAVINDCGNLADIHPHDKETVGQRLALLALKRDYGFADVKADSPTLRSWKIDGDRFILSFDYADGWYLYNWNWSIATGFEIAGPDGKFVPAQLANLDYRNKEKTTSSGTIKGKDLIVFAPGVKEPKKLRYLHSRPWTGTLYNDADLPLGAFHIDD